MVTRMQNQYTQENENKIKLRTK